MNDKRYIGTRWLSLAVVLGVAAGTVIGRLMDNMRTGLMIGLVLAVCIWTLLTQRAAKAGSPHENPAETERREPDGSERGEQQDGET